MIRTVEGAGGWALEGEGGLLAPRLLLQTVGGECFTDRVLRRVAPLTNT